MEHFTYNSTVFKWLKVILPTIDAFFFVFYFLFQYDTGKVYKMSIPRHDSDYIVDNMILGNKT